MKKIILITISLMIMIGCSKEKEMAETIDSVSRVSHTGIQPYAASDGNISCGTMPNFGVVYANGMLCFSSSSVFKSVYAYLDCGVEKFSGYNSYLSLYNGDLYKIDSALDAAGADEDKYLIEFESRYAGYLSLRKKLSADEESYLAGGGDPATASNPNTHASDDQAFNTLLNDNGCFKIGDTIVKIFPNGVSYLVTNGSMSTLSQITDYYSTHVFTAPNVIALWNEDTTNIVNFMPCNAWLNISTTDNPGHVYTYSGKSYKFVTTVKVTNVPFFHAYTAMSKNYVWKNNRWKKARIYMYANVKQSQRTCRRIDGTNKRFPSTGYIYRKHVRAIYKSNIFHIFNNGTYTTGNTLYIAGEIGNLRAVNGLKYGSNLVTSTVILR